MVDKSLKYYDEEKLYPKSEYMRENHTKTKIWGIRLTNEEIDTWKKMKLSKRIHEILTGEDQSNGDSINLLKELYTIMDNKMNPIKPLSENEIKILTKIEELIE